MAARNAKRSISTILRKIEDCEKQELITSAPGIGEFSFFKSLIYLVKILNLG